MAFNRIDLDPAALVRRTAIVVGTTLGLLLPVILLIFVGEVLLLAFAGVLLAVLLRGLTDWLDEYTALGPKTSYAVVVAALFLALAGGGWLLGTTFVVQANQLIRRLPEGLEQIGAFLQQYEAGQAILANAPPAEELIGGGPGNLFARLTDFFSMTVGAFLKLILILAVGLYGGAEPDLYLRGVLHLVPAGRRERAREVIGRIVSTLRWWLLGRLLTATIVGTASGVGLWLIGVPQAATLGVITGVLELIPYIGPFLAFIPAVLVALIQSPTTALYVALLYLVIQSAESYLLTPLVERRTVRLPPALTLVTLILLGLLFGPLGLILGSPLTATALVTVKMLYVQDVLGDSMKKPPVQESEVRGQESEVRGQRSEVNEEKLSSDL